MAGFGKIAFIGEHFTNAIVNVFHFRSTEWLPGQGNPFDDVLAFVQAVVTAYQAHFIGCQVADYTLLRAEGVGYDDAYNIVTASPLVVTINQPGYLAGATTSGSFVSANIGLRCGEQVQINGVGKSRRNRGYLSMGPISENWVDDYGHVISGGVAALDTFAQVLDDGITVVTPAVTLTPIRVHEKWVGLLGHRTLLWRTYSDVKGYTLPRMASVRRSRMGEA